MYIWVMGANDNNCDDLLDFKIAVTKVDFIIKYKCNNV